MTTRIVTAALRDYLLQNEIEPIRIALAEEHPADVAEYLGGLEAAEAARLILLLPARSQARVFGYCAPERQVAIAAQLPRAALATIITNMSHDERADLFKRLTGEQQEALLPGLAQAEREDIRRLAAYPEGTAGSIMTSDYATLAPGLTARAAIEALRQAAPDKETIYDAYVVDEARRLIGVVSLRDLILAPAATPVERLMRRDVICGRVQDPRDEIARKIAHYDLLALPIVNGGDMLVGIVTQDDAMDVQEAETTSTFHKTATVSGLTMNVRDASIGLLYRARIVWLVLLVFGNVFSGAGLAAFEDTIQAYVALVFFLPLLIDSGGNAGSQSATLMVRALATGDVRAVDWGRMIGREVLVAGLLGLTMAAAVSLIGMVRAGPAITLVVALAMILIVLIGSTIGMSLPFLLTRLKLDPAAASAPLITSIADAVGILVYFAIATALLAPPPG
jgi:magnesium transporter